MRAPWQAERMGLTRAWGTRTDVDRADFATRSQLWSPPPLSHSLVSCSCQQLAAAAPPRRGDGAAALLSVVHAGVCVMLLRQRSTGCATVRRCPVATGGGASVLLAAAGIAAQRCRLPGAGSRPSHRGSRRIHACLRGRNRGRVHPASPGTGPAGARRRTGDRLVIVAGRRGRPAPLTVGRLLRHRRHDGDRLLRVLCVVPRRALGTGQGPGGPGPAGGGRGEATVLPRPARRARPQPRTDRRQQRAGRRAGPTARPKSRRSHVGRAASRAGLRTRAAGGRQRLPRSGARRRARRRPVAAPCHRHRRATQRRRVRAVHDGAGRAGLGGPRGDDQHHQAQQPDPRDVRAHQRRRCGRAAHPQ